MKKLLTIMFFSLSIALQAAETAIVQQPLKLSKEPFELIITKPKKESSPTECQVCVAMTVLGLNPDTIACVIGTCLVL